MFLVDDNDQDEPLNGPETHLFRTHHSTTSPARPFDSKPGSLLSSHPCGSHPPLLYLNQLSEKTTSAMASNGSSLPVRTKGTTVPFFIGGKDVVSSETFGVTNSATGEVVHQCSSATEADAKAAVDAAAQALPAWRAMVPTARRDIFLKAAEIMERRSEELANTMVEELGVAKSWAGFNLTVARSLILDVAGRLVTIEGSIPTPQDPNTGALVLKEPFGVVLAIAPW